MGFNLKNDDSENGIIVLITLYSIIPCMKSDKYINPKHVKYRWVEAMNEHHL